MGYMQKTSFANGGILTLNLCINFGPQNNYANTFTLVGILEILFGPLSTALILNQGCTSAIS